jgi:hypothetical protein
MYVSGEWKTFCYWMILQDSESTTAAHTDCEYSIRDYNDWNLFAFIEEHSWRRVQSLQAHPNMILYVRFIQEGWFVPLSYVASRQVRQVLRKHHQHAHRRAPTTVRQL